jgi:hypothetical protein
MLFIILISIVSTHADPIKCSILVNSISNGHNDLSRYIEEVDSKQKQIVENAKQFISIAKDVNRSDSDREIAIETLSNISIHESYSFLLENIVLKSMSRIRRPAVFDDDDMKKTPCLYYLYMRTKEKKTGML